MANLLLRHGGLSLGPSYCFCQGCMGLRCIARLLGVAAGRGAFALGASGHAAPSSITRVYVQRAMLLLYSLASRMARWCVWT